ncbi:MAG: Ig-like domain-containing protein, partial [Candidatus Methanomethylophilaceae archaeon]|nr:Ig-like domain-containing protein [Candidatus Methanomethylophilaceae archaeon]
ISPGKAKITATSVDGGHKAVCNVTVWEADILVTGISLDKSSLSLSKDGSYKLKATIIPADASLKEIDWMTSDSSVATVDQDGNVKGVSPGKATITAISVDKALKAYCEVTVEEQSQGGASSNLLLYAAIGIVAIVAILGAALFLRGKSR